MIAKRIGRKAGASNFARLGGYILDEKADALSITQRTVDYILDRDGQGHRVGVVRFSNCAAETPADAIKEIIATQAMNVRAKGDRTYHLVVSFAAGERPMRGQLMDIENTLCAEIGLGHHQRLSAVHTDTDHLHIHIAINKVDPTSFRMIEPYYDQRRLMAACEALERKHGLQRTHHGRVTATPLSKRNRISEKEDAQRFRERVRQIFDHHFEARLANMSSWLDLHRFLNGHGLELRLRGAGLVIAAADGSLTVKASTIHRSLSLGALTGRFGPFSAPDMIALATAKPSNQDAFAAIKASYSKRGNAIKRSRTLTAVGKRAAYRDLAKLRRDAFERLKSESEGKTFPRKRSKAGSRDRDANVNDVDHSNSGTALSPNATPSAALKSYITLRNSLREKISDINHHSCWTPDDAGPVVFQGRRRLGDGSWAILLLKGETMLVKAISNSEADTVKLWPIGKAVMLDTGGRVVRHGRVR